MRKSRHKGFKLLALGHRVEATEQVLNISSQAPGLVFNHNAVRPHKAGIDEIYSATK